MKVRTGNTGDLKSQFSIAFVRVFRIFRGHSGDLRWCRKVVRCGPLHALYRNRNSTRRVKLLRNRKPILDDTSFVRRGKCYRLNVLRFCRFGHDTNRALKRICR